MAQNYDVFLSYRRSDGAELALKIETYLKGKGLRVFLDVHELIDGQYFHTQLRDRLLETPNYVLIATPDVFKFRKGEDWVREEIQLALSEYEKAMDGRLIYPIVPSNTVFPQENELPQEIRMLPNANRLNLKGEIPTDEELLRLAKTVCMVNRRNLWHSGQRYLERSRQKGGRFYSLDINETILSMANTKKSKTNGHLDIMVNSGEKNDSIELLTALDKPETQQDNLYLIGEGGIGKTTALVRIMEQHYKDKLYSPNDMIPIFVELNRAPITDASDNFPWCRNGRSNFILREICRMLRGEDSIRRTSDKSGDETADVLRLQEEFRKDTDKPEYLLLLDGLNEVSSGEIHDVEGGKYFIRALIIDEIKRLLEECQNVRVILTSRTDETEINCEEHDIHKLYLSGVDKDTVVKFLMDNDMPKAKAEASCADERLYECLKVPMFLVMYAKLNDTSDVVSRGEIMRRFFHEKSNGMYTQKGLFARFSKNSQLKVNLVRRLKFILDFLIPAIACEMEQKQRFQMNSTEIAKIIQPILTGNAENGIPSDISIIGKYGVNYFKDYANSNNKRLDTANVAQDILTTGGGIQNFMQVTQYVIDCAINEIGVLESTDDGIGFIHQHIRDYFAAMNDINTIGLAVYLNEHHQPDLAFESLASFIANANHPEKSILIGEVLGEHHNAPTFQGGAWQYNVPAKDCDRNLLKCALAVLRGKFGNEVGYGVYNFIEILKLVRQDLSGADLSELDLTLVTLNGVRLGHTENGGTNFQGAKVNMENLLCQGHSGNVNSVAYAPDGKTFCSGSADKTIKEWDRATGKCLRTYEGHSDSVNSVAYAPDGKTFCSGSADKTIKEWDRATGKCLRTYKGHSDPVTSVAYAPNGKIFISGSYDKTIKEWDRATGQCRRTYKGHSDRVTSVAYAPDGKTFCSGSADKTIKEWDRATGQCLSTYEGHSKPVSSVAYAPDGKTVLSGSWDSTIKEWDRATGQCLSTYNGYCYGVTSVTYAPDGKAFLSGSKDSSFNIWPWEFDDSTIKEWDRDTGQCLRTYQGHSKSVTSVTYAPDGKTFISGAYDYTIKEWDSTTSQCLRTYQGYNNMVTSVAYAPDGKTFCSGSFDNTIKEWDRATGQCLRTYKGHSKPVTSVAYAPDDKTVLSGACDNTIKEWDRDTGQCLRTYKGHSSYVTSVAYAPDGRTFISGADDYTIKEWDRATGQCLRTYKGHSDWVCSVAYAPDGKTFISGSIDGTVRVWSTETGECLQVIPNCPGLFIFNCDMRGLHAGSEIDKDVLRQYGALVD